ncbi:MAG: ATP-binding protein [Actinomycetota bacterium]
MSQFADNGLETAIHLAEDTCAREPIHAPGAIQGHGVVLVFAADGTTLLAASDNVGKACPGFDRTRPFDWLPAPAARLLADLRDQAEADESAQTVDLPGLGPRHIHCFRAGACLGLEFEIAEPAPGDGTAATVPSRLAAIVRRFGTAAGMDDLAALLVGQVRSATGFDRILLYRFSEAGHGEVIAEALAPDWDQSLLGLHFPASDIPAQARALYCRVHARWTPSREHERVELSPPSAPGTGEPFDLTFSSLRAVSPIHTLYQRNLGVDGAMAVSIMVGGSLWGLLVGHHRTPLAVAPVVRDLVVAAVDAFALRLGALLIAEDTQVLGRHTARLNLFLNKLAGAPDAMDALFAPPLTVAEMFEGCSGGAIVSEDDNHALHFRTAGDTPPADEIVHLLEWLRAYSPAPLVHTDCISSIYPAFAAYASVASGVLVAFLGEDRRQAILWFRPELVREVQWGGRPEKTLSPDGATWLPRRSFDRWIEQVHGHSARWLPQELHVASIFGTAISKVILRQNRRIRDLNSEVERFLWVSSHHLREAPRRISIGCDLLRRRCSDEQYAQIQDIVADIRGNARSMDTRLRGLLDYSEFGHVADKVLPVPLAAAVAAAEAALSSVVAQHQANIRVLGELPVVSGDARALQFVFERLIDNALTYRSQDRRPDIRIWAEAHEADWIISVTDNGIGIESEFHERVFGLFERLHPNDHDGNGVGMGLTLCRRIIERLGGRIWLTSTPFIGTTVCFQLPGAGHGAPEQASTGSVNLAGLLRDATRSLHDGIKTTPLMAPLNEGRVSVPEYRRALAALYGFYRPAEDLVFTRHADVATTLGVVPKTPALFRDLENLGMGKDEIERLPLCEEVPGVADADAALGFFYVLEGATLGGQIVLRRVAHCLGPLQETATSFHNFHGDHAGPHWRAFIARAVERAGSRPQAQQAAVACAVEAFMALTEWLKRDQQG